MRSFNFLPGFVVSMGLLLVTSYIVGVFVSNTLYDIDLHEPKTGQHSSDEKIYLKTFYLVEQGTSYYSALDQANKSDIAGRQLSNDTFKWRMPTIFYLWTLTSRDGYGILRLFWMFVVLTLCSIYLILRKFLGFRLAILGPLLLLPYLADAVSYSTSFLLSEWWGWFFMTIAMCLFMYDKRAIAWPLFLLAGLSRELMLIPIICLVLVDYVLQKNWKYFGSIAVGIISALLLHHYSVGNYLQTEGGFRLSLITSRFHRFDLESFHATSSFLMRKYPFVNYRMPLVFSGLAVLALVKNLVVKTDRHVFYFLTSVWSLMICIPFIITGSHTDYWGILFMPWLISSIPLIFISGKYHHFVGKN